MVTVAISNTSTIKHSALKRIFQINNAPYRWELSTEAHNLETFEIKVLIKLKF